MSQVLRPLTKELLQRGHHVTTVRFAMEQELRDGLADAENHTEVGVQGQPAGGYSIEES